MGCAQGIRVISNDAISFCELAAITTIWGICFRSIGKLLGWSRYSPDTVLAQSESRGLPCLLASNGHDCHIHVQDRVIVLGILLQARILNPCAVLRRSLLW